MPLPRLATDYARRLVAVVRLDRQILNRLVPSGQICVYRLVPEPSGRILCPVITTDAPPGYLHRSARCNLAPQLDHAYLAMSAMGRYDSRLHPQSFAILNSVPIPTRPDVEPSEWNPRHF